MSAFLKLSAVLCTCLLISAALLDWYYPLPLQSNTLALQPTGDFARVVTDRYGRTLRAFPDREGMWRYPVTLDQVSTHYVSALITYEDRWFWHHPGVNPLAILRASWQNFRCGCVVSGGSTLTMQVARRLFPHHKTVSGKMHQALRALQLEWHLSKEQILTLYLNYVPMGGVIEGVEAASQIYLDKPAAELSLAEGALLAVLPQAPSRLRPDRYPDRASKARNKVLERLLVFGTITPAEHQNALLESLFAYAPRTPQFAPLLSRSLIQAIPDKAVITTTLDADLQFELESLLAQEIQRFPPRHSGAILVLDNATHEVRAYLGSADFSSQARFGHVDMVKAQRSPGSTLKPFIYGLALDDGLIHGASLLRDVPRLRQDYQPDNFSSDFSGPVSPRDALRYSLNLPAVQVLDALTPERLAAALATVGTTYQLPASGTPNLALALGGGGMNLWDLVTLYSSLTTQGQVHPPRTHSPDDSTDSALASRWLLSPEAAWVTANLLRNPLPNRARSTALAQQVPTLAWKTGTSYGYRDAWALGMTPTYTVGVWLGRPDGTPSPGHFGGVTALPLLQRLFNHLDRHPDWPTPPDQVQKATACWPLGRLIDDTPNNHCHQQQAGWIIRNQVPPTLRDSTTDGLTPNPLPIRLSNNNLLVDNDCDLLAHRIHTLATWPITLEPWISPHWRLDNQLPASDPRCPHSELPTRSLRITGIESDSRVRSALIHQGGSAGLPTLSLGSQGGLGHRDWYLNGQFITTSPPDASVQLPLLTLGQQHLLVIDEHGNADRLTFYLD